MSDHNPEKPRPPVNWDEVSAQEIEQTLHQATQMAGELAGGIGSKPAIRNRTDLENVESALDSELKEIEYLVDRTREELDDGGQTEPSRSDAAVPDFMAEFLSDDPVTVGPEGLGQVHSGSPPPDGHTPVRPAKAGLVGVGTLGKRKAAQKKPPLPKSAEPLAPPPPTLGQKLEPPAYRVCTLAVRIFELLDMPFTRLPVSTRRALSVVAITAFCVCLAMFVLSLLFN